MYKYAAPIICFFVLFCNGCEENAAPPPEPKVVHKKIDQKPVVKPSTGKSIPPGSRKDETDSRVRKIDGPLMKGDNAARNAADPTGVDEAPEKIDVTATVIERIGMDDHPLNEQSLHDILNLVDKTAKKTLAHPSGYSAENKIDPFEPLIKPKPVEKPKPPATRKKPVVPTRRLTPLEKMDLNQLKLVGIVRADSGNKALIEDSTGKGYIVVHGTCMGIHSGKVVDILKDRVVVEEEDKDLSGNVRIHKRELKFQRPSGDDQYEM